MSERKVLNKYYPPDFDPSKIPKLRLPRNRQYSIRIMAPFNMKCNTCGEYIYKGKKFNSRKETVENEDYLGLKIFRFYIKCPRCVAEIAFKTDPQKTDYELEDGATRNFEALKTAEVLAEQERKAKEEEELNNPMKVLENRTKASRQEMEMLETLEELRELNSRHAKVDHEKMLDLSKAYEEQLKRLQDEEDENFIQSLFGKSGGSSLKRLVDEDEEVEVKKPKVEATNKPTDVLTRDTQMKKPGTSNKTPASWERSVGTLSSKSSLSGLVKKKPLVKTTNNTSESKKKTEVGPTYQDNSKNEVTSSVVKPDVKGSSICNRDDANPKINNTNIVSKGSSGLGGLGLLGNYSGSSSGEESD